MESQTPLTISAEYGLIDQNKFFGKRIAAKDLSNYYLIQKGEFAYNKSTSNDAPWGAIKRLDCYNNGALSTLYIVFKIKDNKSCYSDFLVTYYGTSLWHKGVKEIASEGARNHGLLNVSPSDFFRTKLVIPQDFEEQRKIGAFFTQLDNTITLQQRKLNSLQKLKKGLLQKMFPKNGENIPEIRFPEFSDAWKQRKFGDVLVSIQTGTNKLGSDRNSGQPLLKMGNLQSGYFDLSKLEFLENKAEPENIVKQGDFFFNTRNTLELVGKGATWFGESNKYAFNSNIARFTLKDINTGFFNYLYNTNYVKKQIRARAMGTTSVAAIYPRSLKSVDIVIPNMEEQIKLSNLFMNLDSTITLQQRKLNSLQKLKKGLLQKMFPKNGENIPEIRFPEFSDAWKQRKFSDSFDFLQNNTLSRASLNDTSGCAKNVHYGDILVKFGESISAEKADLPFICEREILKKLSKSILKNGDVVIADTAEDMTTGKSCEIVDVDECMPVLAGLHTIPVRPKQKFGKYYLGYYLNSEAFHSQLIPLIQGIKVYSISKSSIKDTVVMFPDDVQEQEKIGSLFNRIDNTITLQQRWLFYTHKQS